MDRLKALSALKAVVDHAGFSRGAEAMNMSKSATTRLIQDLEDEMGVRLLIRTTRRLTLTAVGQCVYDRASALLDSYEEISFMCKENISEPCGRIRLEVPALFGIQRLGPVLASFVDLYPRIKVDLHFADGSPDVLSDHADVAISVGRGIPQTLVARALAPLQMGLYASRRYLQSVGEPEHPNEVIPENFMVLGDQAADQSRELFDATTGVAFSVNQLASLRANHAEALVGAAVHGAGIALIPSVAANAAQSQGLLVPVLTSWWPKPLDVHLVYRSPRFQPMRVRKLIDHLLETMAKLEQRTEIASREFHDWMPPTLLSRGAGRQLMVA